MKIRAIMWAVWLEMLRRKDFYVLLILLGALLITLSSFNIFGLGAMVRYVTDIGLLFCWIFGWILSVHVMARELPREEERRTIQPLLARPVSRIELVLGKWLGAWTIVMAAVLVFYLMVWGITVGQGGAVNVVALIQGFLLHSAALAMVTALALLFSTRLHADAAATLTYVVSGMLFLIAPRLPYLVSRESGIRQNLLLVLYNLMPHFELFDMRRRIVHDYGPAPWGAWFGVLGYGMLWAAFIVILAWQAYRRKRFVRGAVYGG